MFKYSTRISNKTRNTDPSFGTTGGVINWLETTSQNYRSRHSTRRHCFRFAPDTGARAYLRWWTYFWHVGVFVGRWRQNSCGNFPTLTTLACPNSRGQCSESVMNVLLWEIIKSPLRRMSRGLNYLFTHSAVCLQHVRVRLYEISCLRVAKEEEWACVGVHI